jgi:hypothetical protein
MTTDTALGNHLTRSESRKLHGRVRQAVEEAPPVPADQDDVPGGTVSDVVRWVGSDASRAQRALDRENAQADPRTSLVDALEKIVSG